MRYERMRYERMRYERMRYEHMDNVSLYAYIETYIHRYSEFTIYYSCIQGSLRLTPN